MGYDNPVVSYVLYLTSLNKYIFDGLYYPDFAVLRLDDIGSFWVGYTVGNQLIRTSDHQFTGSFFAHDIVFEVYTSSPTLSVATASWSFGPADDANAFWGYDPRDDLGLSGTRQLVPAAI